MNLEHIQPASPELQAKMERLRQMPLPTPKEVEQQIRASEKFLLAERNSDAKRALHANAQRRILLP